MSNRVETLEVLMNSHDPKTSIKISNDTEASRDLIFTQLDKLTTEVILNEIDHATGVITKGIKVASNETITAFIKSTDYSTNFFTFGAQSEVVTKQAVSGASQTYSINVSATDTDLAGDYIILPLVNSGVEEEHLFWFQVADGTAGNYPPTGLSGYIYHEVDITSSGNQAAANLKTAIDGLSHTTATVSGNTVTVTASTGAVSGQPEVSDTTNLGVAVTQIGVTAAVAQYKYTLLGTGQTMTYTTGEQEKEAKILIELNSSSGNEQKTIARQDCTVIRSA